MTRERFHRLEELVDAAARVAAGGSRDAWLRAHCADPALRAEVDALLREDPPDGFLEPIRPAAADAMPAEPQPGDQLGPWRLGVRVRRGGMGTVYRATRADGLFDREVAVKVLHELVDAGGLGARFRRESQLLGRLDHPYIVRLLDAGATADGVPWLAMEFAEGVACAQWAAGRDENTVLRLFLRICEAVQTAHAQLVVHRDLKPSNILVNEAGEPRVLDFGEARLLEGLTGADHTRTGGRGFTVNYASPAQILGQAASTADDIYALGVVLLEMLTGRRPRDLAGLALPDLVRYAQGKGDDAALDTSGLAPDLAAVVRKAMAHDAGARYVSVESLAADLRRYLQNFPVEARAPGWSYRTLKFVARRRVALAMGLALLSLLGVGAAMILRASAEARAAAIESARLREVAEAQARLARQQQLQAEAAAARETAALRVAARNAAAATARFNDVRALAGALIYTLEPEAAKIPGSTVFRKQLIDQATAYLDKLSQSLRGEPGDAAVWEEVAEAWNRLGRVQGDRAQTFSLGDAEGSLASYRKALAAQERRARLLPSGDREARRRMEDARITLAAQLRQTGRQDEAKRLFAAAGARLSALLRGQRDDATLRTFARLRFYEDHAAYLELSEELLARHPDDPASLRNAALGHKYIAGSAPGVEALRHAQRALELDQRLLRLAPDNQGIQLDVSFDWSMIAGALAGLHRDQEALAAFHETVAIRRKLMQADPANVRFRERLAAGLNLHAYQSLRMGRRGDAQSGFAEARSLADGVRGKVPVGVGQEIEAAALGGLALAAGQTGGGPPAEACGQARRAAELLETVRTTAAPLAAMRPEIERVAAACGKVLAP